MKKDHKAAVLYISYDGMTDPLGQSQVIPYLAGLSKHGYQFTLLSFEKKDRYAQHGRYIHEVLQKLSISWVPLSFTAYPPVFAKYWDLFQMKQKAFSLHKMKKFDMVHCRSYVSSSVGLALHKKFGVKLLFDMRGFWVDERVDGGLWNLTNPIYRIAYKIYKQKEAQYLRHASTIISLTEAGKNEMMKWPSYDSNIPIEVIPCSADFDHFKIVNKERRAFSRKHLEIAEDEMVISYLGSVGTWYLLDEMLKFFAQLLNTYPKAKFLFITPDKADYIKACAAQHNVPEEKLIVRSALRKEVPELLWSSDVSIFFIKPCYSKLSSSPTKLGEILACGIPVVCNSGVGDVEKIIQTTKGGKTISGFTEADFKYAIQSLPTLMALHPKEIRGNAYEYYNLENALRKYLEIYRRIFNHIS